MKAHAKLLCAILAGLLAASCSPNRPEEAGLLVPRTVDEDASLPSIHVNGTQLHAETFGDGDDPMLVALHGGPGSDYRSLMKCCALADDGYYVVMYDQRGSGLSKREYRDYDVQIYLDDLSAVIAHYRSSDAQKVFLYGHSWGAMLATAFVNEYPQAIAGLILTEPGGFTMDVTMEYVSRWQKISLFGETTNDLTYLDQIVTGDSHEELDYKGYLVGTDHLVGNPSHTPFWRFGAVCNHSTFEYAQEHGFDFTTNLGQYSTPVLFAYSELNEAYGREHAEKVASSFPNVQLIEISGTGHDIPWFKWEDLHVATVAYLAQVNQ